MHPECLICEGHKYGDCSNECRYYRLSTEGEREQAARPEQKPYTRARVWHGPTEPDKWTREALIQALLKL